MRVILRPYLNFRSGVMETTENKKQSDIGITLNHSWILTAIGVLGILAAALLLVPFSPNMPTEGLDPSWNIALNIAVAQGLVFGKDLVFTFGPLASVYSRAYSPETYAITMAASTTYAIAFASTFMLVAWPNRVFVGIAIPFIIGYVFIHDPAFIAFPLFFLYACARVSLPETSSIHLRLTWPVRCALGVAAIALGMLPIIKGSFIGVIVPVAGLAVILLGRRHRYLAISLVLAGLASVCFWWVICGQPLKALPGFFTAQSQIISGYTEAMSYDNGLRAPIAFILASIVACVVIALRIKREGALTATIVTAATAWTLFVAFKAGFVRHDAHAFISAGALLIVACVIICFVKPSQATVIAIVSIVASVMAVRSSGYPGSEGIDTSELRHKITSTWDGIRAHLNGDNTLPVQYNTALDVIQRAYPLPKLSGSVDVFPVDLAMIFANRLKWSGRPIFQSYSAYTPSLLKLNADFMSSTKAPDHVFFRSFPIDYRPMAMDDSLSQLVLLDRYRVAGREGAFIHFVKAEPGRVRMLDNSTTQTGHWGEAINVGSGPMWVSIDVQQTLVGKLAEAAFKPPQLEIDFTLQSGAILKKRYIPKIGQAGFIVSPYLETEQDFADLADGKSPRFPVKSFTLVSSHTSMWKDSFLVKETPLQIGQ